MRRLESVRGIILVLFACCVVLLSHGVWTPKSFAQGVVEIDFLFVDSGGFYCTANDRDLALTERISEELDFRALLEKHGYDPAPLPRQTEVWAMERLGLRYGEKVLGIVLAEEDMFVFELEGLALRPSGDGGFSGLLARLGTDSTEQFDEDAISKEMAHRPIGVCWRLGDTRSGRLRVLAGTNAVAEDRRNAFREHIQEMTSVEGELADIFVVDVSDSPGVYMAEVTCEDASVLLFGLYDGDEGVKHVPFFYPASNASEPFLLLEAGRPDSDVSMYSTAYSILADITGNGLPELFVRSTVSYLFSLEGVSGDYRWRMLRSYYRGP